MTGPIEATDSEAPSTRSIEGRFTQIGFWGAAMVAFAPALIDWAGAIRTEPEAFVSILGLIWFARLTIGLPRRPIDRRMSWGLLIPAIAVLLVGVVSETALLLRLSLAIGVMAIGLRLGRPTPSAAFMLLLAIPIPTALVGLTTPWLEHAELAFVSPLVEGAKVVGPVIRWPEHRFELHSIQTGWSTLQGLVLLGFYATLRGGFGWRHAIWRSCLLGLGVVPIQLASLALALGIADSFGTAQAALWLEYGILIVVACIGTLTVERANSGPKIRAEEGP